jgi:hypothetical protein
VVHFHIKQLPPIAYLHLHPPNVVGKRGVEMQDVGAHFDADMNALRRRAALPVGEIAIERPLAPM